MHVTLLKAKLHQACVTHTDPDCEGAFSIDGDLLELAGIHEYEQIQIYNATSGERITSYAVRAEHGSHKVSVNGVAAHKAAVGDRLIICAYVGLSTRDLHGFRPAVIFCDERNHITGTAAKDVSVPMLS